MTSFVFVHHSNVKPSSCRTVKIVSRDSNTLCGSRQQVTKSKASTSTFHLLLNQLHNIDKHFCSTG